MATLTIKLEDSLAERLSRKAKQMNSNLQKYIEGILVTWANGNSEENISASLPIYRTSDFIDSLVVKGEIPVPEDMNGIDALLDEKYAI
ncbi:MAG: hypothetical protein IJB28_03755 [Bacteroidaceae bacterium]|nr:hypothetical protein [Bacteroidaceae bacterium]MBQ6800697.1 hypothetical protein [Bacteroidaceae bacterium]